MDDYDIGKLDEVIHGRVRLAIMAYLAAEDIAAFTTLKEKLGVADGTLSIHLRKLEEAGFVSVEKTFRDRKPLTRARLTSQGRRAFKAYLEALANLTRGSG